MENQSQNKLEIHQLLVKIRHLLEKDEKFELEDKARIKFENVDLKLKLVEMRGKIQQMSDQLQQKDMIICEKDDKIIEQVELLQQKDSVIAKNQVIISQRDELVRQQEVIISEKVELVKQKEEIIVEKNELLQHKDMLIGHYRTVSEQKEVVISEQKDLIIELNVIIDEKELDIISKEDFIEQKIDMIRNLELRITDLNRTMSSMSQHISELELDMNNAYCQMNNARRQFNANRRNRQPGSGETLFDQLKMKYKNAMVRFQHREKNLVDKIASLEQSNSFLNASLEQNRNSDVEVREMNFDAPVLGETTDAQQNMAIDNDENKDPNDECVGLDGEESHFNRVESDLLKLIDDESDDKPVVQTDACPVPSRSCPKKSSNKKIPKARKKVKFTKNVTAVFFSI